MKQFNEIEKTQTKKNNLSGKLYCCLPKYPSMVVILRIRNHFDQLSIENELLFTITVYIHTL